MNYFSIQSNLDKMTAMSLMMMTSKITLPTTAIATRYSTRYSNFLLLLDSNSTRSQKPLLAGACSGDPMGQSTCSVRPPSSDTKCIFPFKYLGKTYTACTFDDDTEAWCATKLDLFGNMVEGNKARCGDECSVTQPATSRLIIFLGPFFKRSVLDIALPSQYLLFG